MAETADKEKAFAAQLARQEQRIADLTAAVADLEDRKKALEEKLAAARQQAREMEQKHAADLSAAKEGYETKLAALNQKHRQTCGENGETIKQLRAENEALTARVAEMAEHPDVKAAQKAKRAAEAERLRQRLAELEKEEGVFKGPMGEKAESLSDTTFTKVDLTKDV